jgi:hypothetical protein
MIYEKFFEPPNDQSSFQRKDGSSSPLPKLSLILPKKRWKFISPPQTIFDPS